MWISTTYLVTFIVFFIIIIVLRLSLPYIVQVLSPKSLKQSSYQESTEWLNFVLNQAFYIAESPQYIDKINMGLEEALSSGIIKVVSLGIAPTIKHVSTCQMQEADDVKMVFPIDIAHGPSVDIRGSNWVIEFDLKSFSSQIHMNWPGNKDSCIELMFCDHFHLDFVLNVRLFSFLNFSITEIPVLGPTIKYFVILFLQRQKFKLPMPK